MHVRVDEARDEEGAADVEALAALRVAPEPDDVAVDDRDVDLEPLLGEDGQHAPAGQDQVGRLVAPSDSHPSRVDSGQG